MNRIKQLRDELKISQSELGKKLNKTQQQISLYENGTNELDLDGYLILSKLFNCSIEYIAGKTDIKNPGKQIDDVLNEAMIGMSKKDYEALTETQKKQIRDFALFIKKQNEANNKEK